MKQAKATLALLMAPASKGKITSEKSSKKSSEKALQKTKKGAALADTPAPELCVEYQADYDKAKSTAETAKNKCEAAVTEMRMPSTRGTRFSMSRWRLIHSRIFKVCPGKVQGDLRGSHLTTALCFTFSLCFRTMQLSKKNTTFPTCSRSPRGLAYISLYSAYSSSTPTLRSCPDGTTVGGPVQDFPPFVFFPGGNHFLQSLSELK